MIPQKARQIKMTMLNQSEHDISSEKPLIDHLTELRSTLIRSLLAVGISTFICFALAPTLYQLLTTPIAAQIANKGLKLVIISPLEQAITYIKLAFYCGVTISVPWLLGEIWHFIAPALKKQEKSFLLPIITIGTLLFAGGLATCFFLVLPLAMETIIGWVPEEIEATISMERYMTTSLQLMMAMGLVFETPLIVAMLIISGLVKAEQIAKIRRFYIVGAFIVAALLTPPEPLSQLLFALPLLLFFELGLFMGRVLRK